MGCKDSAPLSFSCCATEASQIEDDQQWLFTSTAFLVALCVAGVIVQLWYLVKVQHPNGEWQDEKSGSAPSAFSKFGDALSAWRFRLISDNPNRIIREDQRVDDASNETVTFFKAVDDGEQHKGDTVQTKHFEKPGQSFTISFVAPLVLLLVYLVVITSFLAQDVDLECYRCGLRDDWYTARDQTAFMLFLMKIFTGAAILISVLLAGLVYTLCPIQFGMGHGRVPKWEDPKPVNIAPMLASLPSFSPEPTKAAVELDTTAANGSMLDTSHMIVNALMNTTVDMNMSQLSAISPEKPPLPAIKSPTEYTLRITDERVGLEIVNLGYGNCISGVERDSIAEKVYQQRPVW